MSRFVAVPHRHGVAKIRVPPGSVPKAFSPFFAVRLLPQPTTALNATQSFPSSRIKRNDPTVTTVDLRRSPFAVLRAETLLRRTVPWGKVVKLPLVAEDEVLKITMQDGRTGYLTAKHIRDLVIDAQEFTDVKLSLAPADSTASDSHELQLQVRWCWWMGRIKAKRMCMFAANATLLDHRPIACMNSPPLLRSPTHPSPCKAAAVHPKPSPVALSSCPSVSCCFCRLLSNHFLARLAPATSLAEGSPCSLSCAVAVFGADRQGSCPPLKLKNTFPETSPR